MKWQKCLENRRHSDEFNRKSLGLLKFYEMLELREIKSVF